MSKVIPVVRAECLIAVNNQFAEDYELYLEDPDLYQEPDISSTVMSTLKDTASAEEALNVLLRLYALQHFLGQHNDMSPWLCKHVNKNGLMLIYEPLFKAASRAPLAHAGATTRGINFDKATFMPILLEETEAEGNA